MSKSLIIKNLMPGLTERGKIKIGRKGQKRKSADGKEWQMPEKLDHFIVTSLDRGDDGNFIKDVNLHKKIGDKPKEIPIKLLFDDIALNFQCRYACYNGKTLFCSGDGESADQLVEKNGRKSVTCPCYRQEPTYTGKDKCKINGTLSVMIDGVDSVGGIYKFRTTGYNSTVGILSSLTLIRSLTGGFIAGLPLKLTVHKKTCTNPVDGSSQTVPVVGVEYAGSVEDLQSKTLKIAHDKVEFRTRLANVEDEVRKLISVDASLIDEAGDIQEEFYTVESATVAEEQKVEEVAQVEEPVKQANEAPAVEAEQDQLELDM